MTDIASLGIKVDSKQAATAERDLERLAAASQRAETSTERLARQTNAAGGSWQRYAAAAARAATVLAALGAAGAGALALLVRRSLEAIDEQAKLARSLDASIDGLRALQIAASDAGVSSGGLTASIAMLNRRLGEAERAGTPAANALDRLGLTVDQLTSVDVDERIALIADAVNELGLNASQAGDLLRQFGIRNSELINLLRGGGDAIRAMRVEVDQFGLSLSEVDAAGVERANDAMSRIGRTTEVFITRLTVALAPALEVAANWMNELARQNAGWRDVADETATRIVNGMVRVADLLLWLRRGYAGLEIANAAWNAVALSGLRAIGEGLALLSDAVDQSDLMAALRESADSAFGEIGARYEDFRALMEQEMPSVGLQAAFDNVRQAAESTIPPVREIISELEAVGPLIATNTALYSAQNDELERQAELQERLRMETEVGREIDTMRDQFRTEEERQRELMARRMEILREGLELELVTRAEYQEMQREAEIAFAEWQYEQMANQYAAEQQMAEQQRAFEQRNLQMRLSAFSGFFGNLATAAAAGGKKFFAIAKALNIAQAVIDGIAAAVAAWRVGMQLGGPPLAAAFAAASTAATGAMIAQIASAEIGAASSGARATNTGGGGLQPQVTTQPAAQARDVTLIVQGDVFGRETIIGLIEGINEVTGDGARLRIA